MKSVICVILLLMLLAGCRKNKLDFNVPECIKNNIETNKGKSDWGIESIEEYKYQGMTVYVYNPVINYADAQAAVVKPDCTILCHLGGISGNRMCNGEKFYEKAVLIRTVWRR